MRGDFTSGITTGTVGSLDFTGYTFDSAKMNSGHSYLGTASQAENTAAVAGKILFCDGSSYTKLFFAATSSTSSAYDKQASNTLVNTGGALKVQFDFPVSGWKA